MKNIKKPIVAAAILVSCALGAGEAEAGVFVSVSPAPVYYSPPPVVYAAPAPVAYSPPVVYAAPAPVVVAPAPVYGFGWGYRHWH